jgi:hypothetical protein
MAAKKDLKAGRTFPLNKGSAFSFQETLTVSTIRRRERTARRRAPTTERASRRATKRTTA